MQIILAPRGNGKSRFIDLSITYLPKNTGYKSLADIFQYHNIGGDAEYTYHYKGEIGPIILQIIPYIKNLGEDYMSYILANIKEFYSIILDLGYDINSISSSIITIALNRLITVNVLLRKLGYESSLPTINTNKVRYITRVIEDAVDKNLFLKAHTVV